MGKDMVPKKIFFTKGVGKHRERPFAIGVLSDHLLAPKSGERFSLFLGVGFL